MKKNMLLIQHQLTQLGTMKPTFKKKIIGYVLAVTFLLNKATTNFIFADGVWDVAKEVCKTIYEQIIELSTPVALVTAAVCIFTLFFVKNEKAVEVSWKWLKRIIICWVVIHSLALILTTVNNTLGTDSTATNFDITLE